MKLSNYAHWIEIMKDEYALFNSILMEIVFVDKEKLEKNLSIRLEEFHDCANVLRKRKSLFCQNSY